jgi:hypothetical protein
MMMLLSISPLIAAPKICFGIVLIDDRKITDMSGKVLRFTDKIFDDTEHILIGYRGGVETFDIFRIYIVGGITLLKSHNGNRYTFDN